jgi:hypothetical protein
MQVSPAEYDWDLSKWVPLVQEKEIVQWLVKKPSDAEVHQKQCSQCSTAVQLVHHSNAASAQLVQPSNN